MFLWKHLDILGNFDASLKAKSLLMSLWEHFVNSRGTFWCFSRNILLTPWELSDDSLGICCWWELVDVGVELLFEYKDRNWSLKIVFKGKNGNWKLKGCNLKTREVFKQVDVNCLRNCSWWLKEVFKKGYHWKLRGCNWRLKEVFSKGCN